jgi:glycosyltransferase involved in cell wall biosynthesis
MKICYFGAYQENHPRNAVMLQALRQQKIQTVTCHSQHAIKPLRLLILAYRYLRHARDVDIIFVAAMGHMYLPLAWLLAKLTRKKLVFDPLVSMFDTLIDDRRLATTHSWQGRFWWYLDKLDCVLADRVILDTDAHAAYFVQEFGLARHKFCVVPVGADEHLFFPQPDRRKMHTDKIDVLYVGNYIPLHGVPFILDAARLLRGEAYQFTLVGDGQELARARQMAQKHALDNVRFMPRISKEVYAGMLNETDVALGIFGTSEKAKRVVPCKAYDALAVGAVLVTAETEATSQYLDHGVNVILCQPESGESLAENLRQIGQDANYREQIGAAARQLFVSDFSTEAIGHLLRRCLATV